VKTTEWSTKVSHPFNRVWKHPSGYLEGCVITEHGIVSAYSQGGGDGDSFEVPSTTLQFVIGGRLYSRTLPRRYTPRGIVAVANRFAREIVQGGEHG